MTEKSIKLCGMDLLIFFYVWLFLHQVFAIAEDVTSIPRNRKEFQEETKDTSCPKGHVPVIALLCEDKCKTVLVCAEDKLIPDKACLEYNGGKVQARFTAPCENFSITPCTSPYNASKSYELFQCFEIYGSVLSPRKSVQLVQQVQKELISCQKELKSCQKELTSCQNWKKAGTIVISILSILLAVIIVFIKKSSIVFFVRKYFWKGTTLKKTENRNGVLNTEEPLSEEGNCPIQSTEQQNNGQEHNSTIKDQAPELNTGQENKSVTSSKDIDVRGNKRNINYMSLNVYDMGNI